MGEKHHPDHLKHLLREINRRLANLESAPRAVSTSVREGTFTILDASGNWLVKLGLLDDGSYGIHVRTGDGAPVLRVSSVEGVTAPRLAVPSAGNVSTRSGTIAGSYTELFRSDFYGMGARVDYDVALWPNGGDMDWRLRVWDLAGGEPAIVNSGTGVTAPSTVSGSFLIPVDCLAPGVTSPIGRDLTIRVEVRRNTGTQPVELSLNRPFYNREP